MQTVLVVDDSSSMRAALRWIINAQPGWCVCGEASNGAEGISAARQFRPDVVVLDFSMPVMNGIEAALQIRKLVPEAHLLLFTSHATATIEEAARLAGVDAFVEKGSREKFLQALQQLELEERVA